MWRPSREAWVIMALVFLLCILFWTPGRGAEYYPYPYGVPFGQQYQYMYQQQLRLQQEQLMQQQQYQQQMLYLQRQQQARQFWNDVDRGLYRPVQIPSFPSFPGAQ